MGLIGGSFCRTIKKHTTDTVLGMDIDQNTVNQAVESGAIDRQANFEDISIADLTFVCLYPQQTIDFITEHASQFKPGSVVADTCGINRPNRQQLRKSPFTLWCPLCWYPPNGWPRIFWFLLFYG